MKLAVCAQNEGLEARWISASAPPYFVILDSESGDLLKSVPNSGVSAAGGRGRRAPASCRRKG